MVAIPADTRLKVEQAVEDIEIEHNLRPYLGISGLGDPCARKLWYGFRLCFKEKIKARNNRLLNRGHHEEPIIVADLTRAGIIVRKTGEDQIEFTTGQGHIKGHADGEADLIPDAPKTTHLLEFKTANEKNFKKMKDSGLKKANLVYYGQFVTYMYLGKYKRGLFIMTNKNTDERYYERIYPDVEHAKELIQRGIDIISSEMPLPKIGNATFWQCKWCKYFDICHYNGAILKTCRTCKFGDICDEGIWECSRYSNLELTFTQQLKACSNYSLLECLRD